jgi:hypothetical protein
VVKSKVVTWGILAGAVLLALGGCGKKDPADSTTPGTEPSVEKSEKELSIEFMVQPDIIAGKDPVTIRWNAPQATECKADGVWSGQKSSAGEEVVEGPEESGTFSLICSDGKNSVQRQTLVTVIPPGAKPELEFKVDQPTIKGGESTFLVWVGKNITRCEAVGENWEGVRLPSGQQAVTPPSNTAFDLVCSGPGGKIEKTAVVKVTPIPGNKPPTVTGKPVLVAKVGKPYEFKLNMKDPEDAPLQAALGNLPRWAQFDGTTGVFSGTPKADDVGAYPNITIEVTDGTYRVAVKPFTITVEL